MNRTELKNEVYKQLNVTTTKGVKALYPHLNLRLTESWEAILEELTLGSMEPNEVRPTTVEPTGESFDVSAETVATADQDDIDNFPTDWAGIALTIQKYDTYVAQAADEAAKPELCDRFVPIDIAEAILSTTDEPDSTVVTFGMLSVDPEWVEDERPQEPLDFLPGANLVDIFSVRIPSDWEHWIQAICNFMGVHSRGAAQVEGQKQARLMGLET